MEVKKIYVTPDVRVQATEMGELLVVSGSETDKTTVHTDDPQDPGNALSRHRSVWDDDDDE